MIKKIILRSLFLIGIFLKNDTVSEKEGLNVFCSLIEENHLKSVLYYIYSQYPSFFYDDPAITFPLNEDKLFDFCMNAEPLISFFEPLSLSSLCYPHSLKLISKNLNNIFKINIFNKEDIKDFDSIAILAGKYKDVAGQLFPLLDQLRSENKKSNIYVIANSDKKYIYGSNEIQDVFDLIKEKLGRDLTISENDFILSHLGNEFDIALIFDYFFNVDKRIILFAKNSEYYYDDFFNFLNKRKVNFSQILFLGDEFLTLYEKLKYMIYKVEDSIFEYNIEFKINPILCDEKKTEEEILLKKLKIITVILYEIMNNIDNN